MYMCIIRIAQYMYTYVHVCLKRDTLYMHAYVHVCMLYVQISTDGILVKIIDTWTVWTYIYDIYSTLCPCLNY